MSLARPPGSRSRNGTPRDPGTIRRADCAVVSVASPAARQKRSDNTAERVAAAWFHLDGRHCAVVPVENGAPTDTEMLGELVVDGKYYAVIVSLCEPASNALDQLSPRELEVALLVAQGHDAKSIGRRLRISFYTVRVHLARIYGKMGLHKQTELTACVASRYGQL